MSAQISTSERDVSEDNRFRIILYVAGAIFLCVVVAIAIGAHQKPPNQTIVLWDSTKSMSDVFDDPGMKGRAMHIAQEWAKARVDEEDSVDVYRLVAAKIAYKREDYDEFVRADSPDALPAAGSSCRVSRYDVAFPGLAKGMPPKKGTLRTIVVIGDFLNYRTPNPLEDKQPPPCQPGEGESFSGIRVVLIHPAASCVDYNRIEKWWQAYFQARGCKCIQWRDFATYKSLLDDPRFWKN